MLYTYLSLLPFLPLPFSSGLFLCLFLSSTHIFSRSLPRIALREDVSSTRPSSAKKQVYLEKLAALICNSCHPNRQWQTSLSPRFLQMCNGDPFVFVDPPPVSPAHKLCKYLERGNYERREDSPLSSRLDGGGSTTGPSSTPRARTQRTERRGQCDVSFVFCERSAKSWVVGKQLYR